MTRDMGPKHLALTAIILVPLVVEIVNENKLRRAKLERVRSEGQEGNDIQSVVCGPRGIDGPSVNH